MPRHANPKLAAKKLVEAVTALVRAEIARSPAIKARAATFKAAAKAPRGSKAKAPSRKLKLSPKVRKMRKQQGQFMGLIRSLPGAKKAAMKKLRKEMGYGAALSALRAMKR